MTIDPSKLDVVLSEACRRDFISILPLISLAF